ncbi:Ig-like domain-containing protein [Curtobacterium caseinilyticum]|uniref:Ig-like domain-containing protein n=1 Tax=Curtobacterium caseinilyticum TaxID=3055137 RepID=A0ABT7TNL4_9MICO|nr:Ig-like domain-containing protein [Curtobacterium caseinilyticum]MDM7891189.1 Ig-like domain-containing protein [Curtobacterium caseinilyticum]
MWHPAALVAVLTAGAVLLGAPTASAATGAGGTDRAQLSQPSAPPPSPQLGALLPQTGTPSPAPSERPAVRPSISDPGDVTTATVRFHGRGTPGHRVRVTGPAATGTTGCSTTVTDDGSWACIATVRSGPQQVFTVADGTDPALGSSAAPASDVVVPPTVSTSRPTSGPVSGTGLPGATVSLSVAGSSADRTATVGGDGRWTVSLAGGTRDGRLTVSAAQTASTSGGYRSDLRSASSAPRTVVLDRTAPAAPVVTAPSRGEHVRTQPVTVRGTGEPGAVLTVYVDRVPVCRADVGADGRWTCTTRGATVVGGTRTVTAMQQDAAGNSSPASAGVRVRLSGAAATPTGDPDEGPTTDPSNGATPGSTPTSATPGRTPTGTATGPGDGDGDGHGASGTGTGGTGTGAGTDSGTGTGTGPTGNGDGTGGGTGPGRGPGGVPDWSGPAGDWTAGTAYDRGIPTIQASSSWSTVLVATGIAAGFLVLVAAPLALVGAAVRGRLRNPFAALLGRNRSRSERRLGDDVLPTWAAASIGVGIVAVATLVGVGVTLEARYVRLAVAVLLGTAVTTAAVVLATRWAAGADRHSVGFRVSPWLVLAALVGCALTRLGDLSPALVVGAVLVPVGRPGADTAALRLGSTLASGVRTATARSVALLGVATVGWVLHSVTPGQGFWSALVTEFATTLCVGAVGALVAVLLPVPGSAGAVLVAGARARYVALTVGAVALAAVVAGGPVPIAPSPTELALATGACAVGAVACWAWLRGSAPGRTPGTH